jgi:peptidoglycan/xylan/chitin deacetylase (PgdA/CDA1 family)
MKCLRPAMQWMRRSNLSPAHAAGLGALMIALLAAPFSLALAALPLALFVGLCFTAPFLPGIGFFLEVVSRGRPEKQGVALTFDDGPDPVSTPALLQLLARYNVQATFYVTGRRAEQYPQLIRRIVSRGHTIGNHSYTHDNFIMFQSTGALQAEIEKTQEVLHGQGVFPHTFRPPVGVTNPKLGRVLQQLEMYVVNFSRRAGDRGNRRIAHLSKTILKNVRAGDIIMLHDIAPRNNNTVESWLRQVERILAGIRARGLKILPLASLIDRAVMSEPAPQSGDPDPVPGDISFEGRKSRSPILRTDAVNRGSSR